MLLMIASQPAQKSIRLLINDVGLFASQRGARERDKGVRAYACAQIVRSSLWGW